MKILSISGSLRSQATSSSLLRAIAKVAPSDMEFITYTQLDDLPFFSPDRDGENSPEVVLRYREALNNADGVLICTPEYAHGIPGVLKNSLDWVVGSGEYVNKPVMALSSSPAYSGGEKAHASLLTTLKVMNTHIVEKASFPVPVARRKVNENDELIGEDTIETFQNALAEFAKAIAESKASVTDNV
ncbi:NAD(P)H-dependent oxidoreductase [Leptospira sp. FAT2]|uniref:NADPH-dependent FMN reductase n=1 Tax=Leptospira sanjuanensis TaxID=2879643 RepID=UPI001EE80715|nr:NADPH-dependent FMN reductase [Leptospira sanjuanensis]MCG6167731.1 NAD(P)H-dependent oxidoreductase [Leptospira sanjuanensis]MCG6193148.1 NAD(P)H-dependent oxidoreductase [Leptospira sanjuanensis]